MTTSLWSRCQHVDRTVPSLSTHPRCGAVVTANGNADHSSTCPRQKSVALADGPICRSRSFPWRTIPCVSLLRSGVLPTGVVQTTDGRHHRPSKAGDPHALLMAKYFQDELEYLRNLPVEPAEDTATLKSVRQSGKYRVWRLSHPFDPNIAVRTICWFDPDLQTIVVVLFAADKAKMGDIFYDSVGSRADQIIDQWLRHKRGEQNDR